MTEDRLPHRLTVVWFTDLVGYRTGVHLGDVAVTPYGDLYGDGVKPLSGSRRRPSRDRSS